MGRALVSSLGTIKKTIICILIRMVKKDNSRNMALHLFDQMLKVIKTRMTSSIKTKRSSL